MVRVSRLEIGLVLMLMLDQCVNDVPVADGLITHMRPGVL